MGDTTGLVWRALAQAEAMDSPYCRARSLAALAVVSPPWSLAVRAWEAARQIEVEHQADRHTRVEVLTVLAPFLPESLREGAMEEAAHLASRLRQIDYQLEAFLRLLPLLPESLQANVATRVLEWADRAACRRGEAGCYVQVMLALLQAAAEHCPPQSLRQALQVARGIEDHCFRAETLLSLRPFLSSSLQREITQEVSRLPAMEPDCRKRVRMLSRLLAYPCACGREDTLRKALEATAGIEHPVDRSHALACLVPHLKGAKRRAALNEALAAAECCGAGRARAEALVAIACRAPGIAQTALAAVPAIRPIHPRVSALVRLLPCLAEPDQAVVLEELVQIAQTSGIELWQTWILVQAAPFLGPAGVPAHAELQERRADIT